jgi:UDP-N-acetylglucosamine--N-acetylmuramyl-(pentapeptide) pyrophosphoryl-undecaprenol N-acetylglucosamine transferase
VLLRRVTVIQEQNASPGITNRLLGRFVTLAFAPRRELERIFPRLRVMSSPVRREILALRERPAAPPVPLPRVFVMGGSQGARAINRAVVDALPLWAASGAAFALLHQSGALDLDWVREAYRGCAIPHQVTPFLDDMAEAYAGSRLVISRAGASAVSEIVAARRASILVPIPNTSGDHQLMNAAQLRDAGAAVLIEQRELTGERLARETIALLRAPGQLDAMERACDGLFSGDSAAAIASACLGLIGHTSARE